MRISFFNKIFDNTPDRDSSILEFLNNVKHGTWANLIKPINAEEDKAKRKALKENTLPYVTLSGTFSKRVKAELTAHSGFICLDIDDSADLGRDWQNITNDRFTYGAFRSASGLGLAVIIKIDPSKHLESFLSLESYYLENYQIILDKSCKDVTRPRFVSFDPQTYINEKAQLFKAVVKKSTPVQKLPQIITGESDLDYLIEQINNGGVDLTRGSYEIWLEIGFSIASELGENGRPYYHSISRFNQKYNPEVCDRQYNHCIKSGGTGIKIATLFYYAKEANLNLVSPKTKHIVAVANQGKRGGRTKEDVLKLLDQVDKINDKDSKSIVEKVYSSSTELKLTEDLTPLEKLELFVKNNYNLKRNEVTRYIENNGVEVDTVFSNSVYFQVKRIVSDKIPVDTVERLISSDFIPDYNPLIEFLEQNAHLRPVGQLDKLARSIDTDTGAKVNDVDPDYKYLFIRKWFVGIVASIYRQHSPILLVLTGGQNTGKTEFFRRLLPDKLKPYYAESKLDAGKDDEILMCQKLLIMDDELGGKSKQEAKKLKELTSKDEFTLREPYGRKNVRLKRLAVLCGTSNDELVLNDPTGNRRIVPINVLSIDHALYNSIDKTELLLEAYHLYNEGYNWRLTADDVQKLNNNTIEFEQIRHEAELISMYYKLPEYVEGIQSVELLTATEIKTYVEEKSGQKLSQWKIGQELKALGFEQEVRKIFGKTQRLYRVIPLNPEDVSAEKYKKEGENYKPSGVAF
jgi:predicted P-loop ATPase